VLCAFGEHYNTQYALVQFVETSKESLDVETSKESLDVGKCIGVVFMDFSKAFDSLNYELLVA